MPTQKWALPISAAKSLTALPPWVTAQEVRATLKRMGMDISNYTNPMAVLHSILHRVAACHRDAEGKLYYGRRDLRPPGSQVVRPKSLPQEEKREGKKNAKARRNPSEETHLRPVGGRGVLSAQMPVMREKMRTPTEPPPAHLRRQPKGTDHEGDQLAA
jgi:hypothetical protein